MQIVGTNFRTDHGCEPGSLLKSIFKNSVLFLLLTATLFVALVAVRWPWIQEGFLLADDNIYFTKSSAGFPHYDVGGRVGWAIFNVLAEGLSRIQPVRYAYLGIFSLALSCCAMALHKLTHSLFIPLIFLVAALNPLNISQGMFVNGSHPMIGTSLLLLSMAASILMVNSKKRWRLYALSGLVGLLYMLSIYAGPITQIAPLAGLVLLFYPAVSKLRWEARILTASTATLPMIIKRLHLQSTGQIYNHYTTLVGWTDFSLSNVVQQANQSAILVFNTIGKPVLWVVGVTVLILLILKVLVARSERPSTNIFKSRRKLWILSAYCLAMSALCFGPASITTSLYERYLVGTLVFFTLFSGIAVYVFVQSYRLLTGTGCIMLAVVAIFFMSISRNQAEHNYGAVAQTHKHIHELIQEENENWTEGAQIVVVVDYSLTGGFNHWSSWYMRYQTGRLDVTALIGRESWLRDHPILQVWSEHGKEHWKIVEHAGRQRSERKRMIGLVLDKPVYIYRIGRDGKVDQRDSLLIIGHNFYELYTAGENGLVRLQEDDAGFEGLLETIQTRQSRFILYKLDGYDESIPAKLFKHILDDLK